MNIDAHVNTYKQARLIVAVAVLTIGCERAPASIRSDSSVIFSAENPRLDAHTTPGTFAYADSSGGWLLALDSVPDPSAILGALCSTGIALPVRYERRQARQPNDNGRQVASNFSKERGDLFRVLRHSAPPDETCYLSPDSALLASARTATVREPSDCSSMQISRIAAVKGRQVIHCWRIAGGPDNLEVLAVQFANIDSSALGSLAVVGDTSMSFKDFPATYRGPDESTWRVDDGGLFSPRDFEILFFATRSNRYAMAFTWAGAEGESSELLIADSAGTFRTLTKGYRYRAPT
jgi:hypothetical protein